LGEGLFLDNWIPAFKTDRNDKHMRLRHRITVRGMPCFAQRNDNSKLYVFARHPQDAEAISFI
jgi:hypothetical protein